MYLSDERQFIKMKGNLNSEKKKKKTRHFPRQQEIELQLSGHKRYTYNYVTHANIKIIQYEMHTFK